VDQCVHRRVLDLDTELIWGKVKGNRILV